MSTHAFIGPLRIATHLWCNAVHGHKPGAPEWLSDGTRKALVETCTICGAQRAVRFEPVEQLVQITT